jgi:hypothetical protein
MNRRRFLSSYQCGKKCLWTLLAVAALTVLSEGETVPGTLTNTATTTHSAGCDSYTNTVITYVWTFTDPAGGKHTFAGESEYEDIYSDGFQHGRVVCGPTITDTKLDEWSSDGLFYLEATGGTGSITSVAGHVNPKFVVIGVTYAPPGPSSYVSYQNSTSLGTTTMNSSSFASGYSESVSVTSGTDCNDMSGTGIFGFSGGVCVTGTQSTSYTMQSMNSSSISVVNKTSIQNKTTGTPNSFSPVDHDYDLVWLWLNPITTFIYSPSSPKSIQWTGYGYDMADQPAMDLWPVLLGYLNGDFGCYATDSSCDPEDAEVLARSWVAKYNPQTWPAGDGPGLTTTDLANIAKADPWGANPNYTVVLGDYNPPTTTDGRFTIAPVNGANTQSFDYKQAGPGNGSGLTQTYTNENTTTTTNSSGGTYTFQEAFGLEEKVGGTFFWVSVQYDFKQSSTFTWVHSFLLTSNDITDSTDALSITGPPCPAPPPGPCNPAYSGLPEFDVYQDNIFGSFMFWGVN